MKYPPVLVKMIKQKDNHSFVIEWSDKKIQSYRLSHLQRQCPCAKCFDAIAGKRVVNESEIKDDLKAKNIVNVGRYALRIQFTSGCSKGIYSFALLRELGEPA